MKKHNEYITIIKRKNNEENEDNSDLELRVCDDKKEFKQLKKSTDKDQRLFYEKIKTDKKGQNIISGFFNYLKNNNSEKYLNHPLLIMDDKRNAIIYSPKNREEYDEIGRKLVDYLEILKE